MEIDFYLLRYSWGIALYVSVCARASVRLRLGQMDLPAHLTHKRDMRRRRQQKKKTILQYFTLYTWWWCANWLAARRNHYTRLVRGYQTHSCCLCGRKRDAAHFLVDRIRFVRQSFCFCSLALYNFFLPCRSGLNHAFGWTWLITFLFYHSSNCLCTVQVYSIPVCTVLKTIAVELGIRKV